MTTERAVKPTPVQNRTWWLAGGMLGLAFGYFFWYTPYAALTKALSAGLLPGIDKQVGGLVLLPAAALGTLAGVPLFLVGTGWWRYIGHRPAFGRVLRLPGRTMIIAGFCMSLVIATTTLNYTFAGVSILFMLLMMRAGVLVLSPIVDAVRRRRVRVYSWLALGFSLLAVGTALADVNSYALTTGAVLSLAVYFTGYLGRFQIMSRIAKAGDEQIDRRYLAEEAVSAAVWQVLLCAILALIGVGPALGALREGFTSFLLTPDALPAFGIGLLYSALYVYGTLIYLDRREYTWCVPANRCASLFSGVVASFGLTWLTGVAAPGSGQLAATGLVLLAVASLSYPALSAALRPGYRPGRQVLLFVCGGNTGRSAMAEAIAHDTLRAAGRAGGWRACSAGIEAVPGTPMTAEAVASLTALGMRPHRHRARRLTAGMVDEAAAVYCMTGVQRDAVRSLAPASAGKVVRLDPDADIPEPHGRSSAAYRECARLIRTQIIRRLAEVDLSPALGARAS
jgi:protein-tyrosine-phosphatase